MAAAELRRKHGVSSATFYAWTAKYGGLDVSQPRKLKALEEENTRLKKLLAEAMLDNAVLRDVTVRSGEARRAMQWRRPAPPSSSAIGGRAASSASTSPRCATAAAEAGTPT